MYCLMDASSLALVALSFSTIFSSSEILENSIFFITSKNDQRVLYNLNGLVPPYGAVQMYSVRFYNVQCINVQCINVRSINVQYALYKQTV